MAPKGGQQPSSSKNREPTRRSDRLQEQQRQYQGPPQAPIPEAQQAPQRTQHFRATMPATANDAARFARGETPGWMNETATEEQRAQYQPQRTFGAPYPRAESEASTTIANHQLLRAVRDLSPLSTAPSVASGQHRRSQSIAEIMRSPPPYNTTPAGSMAPSVGQYPSQRSPSVYQSARGSPIASQFGGGFGGNSPVASQFGVNRRQSGSGSPMSGIEGGGGGSGGSSPFDWPSEGSRGPSLSPTPARNEPPPMQMANIQDMIDQMRRQGGPLPRGQRFSSPVGTPIGEVVPMNAPQSRQQTRPATRIGPSNTWLWVDPALRQEVDNLPMPLGRRVGFAADNREMSLPVKRSAFGGYQYPTILDSQAGLDIPLPTIEELPSSDDRILRSSPPGSQLGDVLPQPWQAGFQQQRGQQPQRQASREAMPPPPVPSTPNKGGRPKGSKDQHKRAFKSSPKKGTTKLGMEYPRPPNYDRETWNGLPGPSKLRLHHRYRLSLDSDAEETLYPCDQCASHPDRSCRFYKDLVNSDYNTCYECNKRSVTCEGGESNRRKERIRKAREGRGYQADHGRQGMGKYRRGDGGDDEDDGNGGSGGRGLGGNVAGSELFMSGGLRT